MKRIFKSLVSTTLVLAVMVACFVFAPVSTVSAAETIAIKGVETVSGDTVTVDINITSNPGIVSMRLFVDYDTSALTLVGVTDNGKFTTKQFADTYGNGYTMLWTDGATTANKTFTGSVATLTFSVNDGVEDLTGAFVTLYTKKTNDILRIKNANLDLESVTPVFTNVVINKDCLSGHDFGDWQEDANQSTASEILRYKVCSRCGFRIEETVPAVQPLKFSGASLTLQDDLVINYKVNETLFTEVGYTDPYVVFSINGVETTVNDYYVKDGKYVFDFENIAPHKMNDVVYSTLYAYYDGDLCASETREYSIYQYCYTTLGRYNSDTYAKLRTLIVDLLNYGSATQEYMSYKTNTLVNKDLTEQQKAWGTTVERPLVSVQNLTYKTIDNPTVTWAGGGLNLNQSIAMRFKIKASDISNLSVKVTNDVGQEATITSDKFEKISDGYYVYFEDFSAAQMSNKVYLTVYEGDTIVSNTISYSIESYAYAKQNDANKTLVKLVKAMIKYGDSAYAYTH